MRLWIKYLCILFLLSLSGCATNLVVKGNAPTPIIAKVPLRVGIYYSPDFKKFKYHEVLNDRKVYNIDFGEQNYTQFRVLMSAMFVSAVAVGQPPLSPAKAKGLDGVIVPQIVKYGFLTPGISGLNFYSASITYRITLYTPQGEMLHEWTLVGYGKSGRGVSSADTGLADATLQAIRDGGARIAIELPHKPVFEAWVQASRGDHQALVGSAGAEGVQ